MSGETVSRDSGTEDFEARVQQAVANSVSMGEISDADAIGTVGSADCGDMLRMWLKFREEEDGRKVIDKASFQSFGCQTAIAVASLATEMLAGKTKEEALSMSGQEMASPLGALPPMKIHCAQMVEDALKQALSGEKGPATDGQRSLGSGNLVGAFGESGQSAGVSRKIVLQSPEKQSNE